MISEIPASEKKKTKNDGVFITDETLFAIYHYRLHVIFYLNFSQMKSSLSIIGVGVESGDTIRVPDAGNAGARGSRPGNLFIKLKVHFIFF